MKKRILLYVLILLIIAICNYLVIKFIFMPNKKISSCKVEAGEIYAEYRKKMIDITSVDTNVDIGDGKKYTRIGVIIEDTNGTDVLMDAYLFQITDKDKNTIAMCHTAATSENDKMVNILPASLPANGKISGYLYCETDRRDVNILKVSYVYEAKYDKNGEVKFDTKALYIHFK